MVSAVVLVSLLLWLHRRCGGKAWAQKQLQSPTVQTQSIKGCQDLVLFRIRNTEPQKTVKSNRGLLSPVTGGDTDGSQVWICRHWEELQHPWKTRACTIQNCMLCFFNKAVKGGSKWLQSIKSFTYFFSNQPRFWGQEKVFAFKLSHFTDSHWANSSPNQTF